MGRRPSRLPTGDCGVADWRELDPSVPIHPNARSPEDVFRDFLARRAGIVKALTKDLWEFYQTCEPDKENLCLYGLPNETWEVSLPAEDVPSELPQPALGINFPRDDLPLKCWLALVASYSDSWLLSVAFYYGGRFGFDKEARRQLFILISGLPTVYEVVTGSAKKQHKTPNGNSLNQPSSKSSKQPSSNSKPTKRPPPKYEEQIGKEAKYEEQIGKEAKYEEHIGKEAKYEEQICKKDEGYEDQDYLCGICEGRYVTGQFWIGCDFCVKWFHGECVCITAAKAEYIKQYKCPSCSTKRSGVIMEHF